MKKEKSETTYDRLIQRGHREGDEYQRGLGFIRKERGRYKGEEVEIFYLRDRFIKRGRFQFLSKVDGRFVKCGIEIDVNLYHDIWEKILKLPWPDIVYHFMSISQEELDLLTLMLSLQKNEENK